MKNPLTMSLLILMALLMSGMAFSDGGESADGITVRPGETKSNGDVTVTNTSPLRTTTARITPGGEPPPDKANSKVKTKSKFEGTVDGVGTGDTVDLGSSNKNVTINTEGGVVNVGSSPHNITINNNAPPGGASTTVNTSAGTSISIPPGSSITINP